MENKSKRFSLNNEDFKKWFTNVMVFLGPAMLAFMAALAAAVQQNAPREGKWAMIAVVALYTINVLIDLLKKFLAGPR